MLNSVTHIFDDHTKTGEGPWQVDRNPGVRLVWLFVVMLLPMAAVGFRLVYLQGFLAENFAVGLNRTTVTYESIPGRDGRILATDGRVLAYDVERFNVRAHYQWLEEPPNATWLRQQALSRLPPVARRDRDRVQAEQQKVLALRKTMWSRLASLSGTVPEDLAARRTRIQERVERILASVRRHRRRQKQESRRNSTPTLTGPDASWWQAAWRTFAAALTTPPTRHPTEPLVVREERDYHTLVEDVPRTTALEIAAHPERYPGIRIEKTTQRVYAEQSLASHVIGSRMRITDEELKARKRRFGTLDPLDYQWGDRIGKTGVERAYDRRLRGLRGVRKIVKNRWEEVIRTEIVRKPAIGQDVYLTLNLPLQERAERILDDVLGDGPNLQPQAPKTEHALTRSPAFAKSRASTGRDASTLDSRPAGGCIVALDVHTGAVLAAASGPRYDLSLLHQPDRQAWQRLLDDPRHPFFPRVTQMTLPPGSVFKTLTAIALLESGQIDPDEPIHCRGFLETPSKYRCYIYRHYGVGHGDTALSDALSRSCNVYFFTAADKMKAEPIVHWARQFGFGRPTGIDLPGERGGNLPAPRRSHPAAWSRSDTLGLAIGQSRLTVTPLQIATLMAAVANDGYLVTPHVVRDGGPKFVSERPSAWLAVREPRRISGLSHGTLRRVREGLTKAVADPRGTGYKRVRLKQIAIAGKTGTAEVGGGKRDHAWFAGYVPADQPRIAFAVVLEHGGTGGRVAGPVARRLVEAMLDVGILQPR